MTTTLHGSAGRSTEMLARTTLGGVTALVVLASVLVGGRIGWYAVTDWLSGNELTRLTALWPRLWGTLFVAGGAISLAVPLALGSTLALAEQRHLRRRARPVLELLAGVPTVIYGVLALDLLAPLLAATIPGIGRQSALGAMLAITFMLLPLLVLLYDRALDAVPDELRHAAQSLGATNWEITRSMVLPMTRVRLTAATLLALARAFGEAMVVTMVAGNLASVSLDPRSKVETLSSWSIALALGDEPDHRAALATVACVLLALVLVTRFAADRLLGERG